MCPGVTAFYEQPRAAVHGRWQPWCRFRSGAAPRGIPQVPADAFGSSSRPRIHRSASAWGRGPVWNRSCRDRSWRDQTRSRRTHVPGRGGAQKEPAVPGSSSASSGRSGGEAVLMRLRRGSTSLVPWTVRSRGRGSKSLRQSRCGSVRLSGRSLAVRPSRPSPSGRSLSRVLRLPGWPPSSARPHSPARCRAVRPRSRYPRHPPARPPALEEAAAPGGPGGGARLRPGPRSLLPCRGCGAAPCAAAGPRRTLGKWCHGRRCARGGPGTAPACHRAVGVERFRRAAPAPFRAVVGAAVPAAPARSPRPAVPGRLCPGWLPRSAVPGPVVPRLRGSGTLRRMTKDPSSPSPLKQLAAYVGFTHAPGGEPLPGGPKSSRFGNVSPRLDQEIEDLRNRIAVLEELVRGQAAPPPAEQD